MKGFSQTNNTVLNLIHDFNNNLDGKIIQGDFFAKSIYDNDLLTGTITGFEFSPCISTVTFDIHTLEDINLELEGLSSTIAEFYFCLEGELLHSIGSKHKNNKIDYWQNVILFKKKKAKSTLHIQQGVNLKMVCTYVSVPDEFKVTNKNFYLSTLRESIDNIADDNVVPYYGSICGRTANYATQITNDFSDSTPDLFFIKAAVLNTIASQLKSHRIDVERASEGSTFSPNVLDKIIALTKFIEDNLSENMTLAMLQRMSGLGQAKLQQGFKYLFNNSVSRYITNARIERALYLLENSNVNVSEAVYSVGITSRSYFAKKFKERYGYPPSELTKSTSNIAHT